MRMMMMFLVTLMKLSTSVMMLMMTMMIVTTKIAMKMTMMMMTTTMLTLLASRRMMTGFSPNDDVDGAGDDHDDWLLAE